MNEYKSRQQNLESIRKTLSEFLMINRTYLEDEAIKKLELQMDTIDYEVALIEIESKQQKVADDASVNFIVDDMIKNYILCNFRTAVKDEVIVDDIYCRYDEDTYKLITEDRIKQCIKELREEDGFSRWDYKDATEKLIAAAKAFNAYDIDDTASALHMVHTMDHDVLDVVYDQDRPEDIEYNIEIVDTAGKMKTVRLQLDNDADIYQCLKECFRSLMDIQVERDC